MADVFVSYSRRDADFVQRMVSSLEERGKSVWIDTQGIADTEVFPQALRSAIEGSDAFLFVITPDSVASDLCEQEVTYARSLEKRIVPALRAPVPDPAIPEEIRHRNWIPFTEAEDVDASLDRVVRALDTDLAACKEHTRWLVKALEWDAEDRDRSFLLWGSELKAAESWLAGTSPEAEPAPTTVQSEYVLASRRAAARRQRTLVTASLVVAVVAVGLGVVALVPRNQAVSAGRTDRVQALAAESQNELSADPEVSVLLARQAVQTDPDPQAVAALRQAVDASAVRVALHPVRPAVRLPRGSLPGLQPRRPPAGREPVHRGGGGGRQRDRPHPLPAPHRRTARCGGLRTRRPDPGGGDPFGGLPPRPVYRGGCGPAVGRCPAQCPGLQSRRIPAGRHHQPGHHPVGPVYRCGAFFLPRGQRQLQSGLHLRQ